MTDDKKTPKEDITGKEIIPDKGLNKVSGGMPMADSRCTANCTCIPGTSGNSANSIAAAHGEYS